MTTPYELLDRKRRGGRLSDEELRAVVRGAVDDSWSEGQLGAFLMAAAIRGLDADETASLTRAMLQSGESWELDRDLPTVGDKHSTGGVGDKVSLVLSPLLAACGQPVAMLTGRGLGHTGGTADKLETIDGLDLALDRARCIELVERVGMAVGMATGSIAPADRRLYALRDVTGTVASMELITASILSKKLATGAAALVFDVKCGDGAFLADPEEAARLARSLVGISAGLGRNVSALLTDMSQPLGRWAGHAAEVMETVECLEGDGPEDLMEVTYALAEEVSRLAGSGVGRRRLEAAVASGEARTRFDEWVSAQGGDPAVLARLGERLAPHEVVLEAPRGGVVQAIATRRLGLLLAAAGGGRRRPGDAIDFGVSLRTTARVGGAVAAGEELGRVYLREADPGLVERFAACFSIGDRAAEPPPLVRERIGPESA